MSDQLISAADAYRAAMEGEESAKARLADARREKDAASAEVERLRGPLAEAIIAAARSGMRQRDILAATGQAYTRERIRQICRAAGVEPQK